MIICICNNISEEKIKEAVDLGLFCPHDIQRYYGGQPQCGKCLEYFRALINSKLELGVKDGQTVDIFKCP